MAVHIHVRMLSLHLLHHLDLLVFMHLGELLLRPEKNPVSTKI